MTNNVYANQADELEMGRMARSDEECPKCEGDRVAIESLPLDDEPATLVCRSCGHVFESR